MLIQSMDSGTRIMIAGEVEDLDQHSHIVLGELDPAERSILRTGLLAVYHQSRIALHVLFRF